MTVPRIVRGAMLLALPETLVFRFLGRAPRLLRGALVVALACAPAVAQKQSPVNGDWIIQAGALTLQASFAEDQGDVTGSVTLPDGKAVQIDYGLIIGKELEFTTVEDGVEYEWTAEVGKNSIKGTRVNLDEETSVDFTAKRAR